MKLVFRSLLFSASLSVLLAGPSAVAQDDDDDDDVPPMGLVATVLDSASRYSDPSAAMEDGYVPLPSCVSGPEEGAMGVHFANEALLADGALDATQPELIVYEPRPNGEFKLIAVEYLVFAEDWDAANDAPPVLEGQHFHLIGEPNRLGLPAFYELHVWAFEENPHGMFVDWNPEVTCEHFDPAE